MKWTKKIPITPGAYWHRNKESDHEPSVKNLRLYGGEIAEGNSRIHGSLFFRGSEWAGPIPLPEEP